MNNMQGSKIIEKQKHMRRPDLTVLIRLYIAFTAMMAQRLKIRGPVSELARQFHISRMFVYMLMSTLEQKTPLIFGDRGSAPDVSEEKVSVRYMLSLRLEGGCSIEAVSMIMKRFDTTHPSAGRISESLNEIGGLLPSTLTTEDGEVRLVVFLSDELFSKNVPILVTAEPQSSAILRIELPETRQIEDRSRHWECLKDNGYQVVYLVSDEGKALTGAQKKVLSDVFRQPDTYHAIARQPGGYVKQSERGAYCAIEKEYEYYEKLDSAKNDRVIDKRIDRYETARRRAEEKIEKYDSCSYLYHCILNASELFNERGELRNRREEEENIKTALDLPETVKVNHITDAVNKIRRTLPDLLNYSDVGESVAEQLKELPLEQEGRRLLCPARQWRKHLTKSKTAGAKHYCAGQEQFYPDMAAAYLPDEYEVMKELVWQNLDRVVQSSSLVECINSVVRPYLNTSKNNVSQEFLNLIMFYHNHRRYKAGKRKGRTPYEILTGKKQDKDWIGLN